MRTKEKLCIPRQKKYDLEAKDTLALDSSDLNFLPG